MRSPPMVPRFGKETSDRMEFTSMDTTCETIVRAGREIMLSTLLEYDVTSPVTIDRIDDVSRVRELQCAM